MELMLEYTVTGIKNLAFQLYYESWKMIKETHRFVLFTSANYYQITMTKGLVVIVIVVITDI